LRLLGDTANQTVVFTVAQALMQGHVATGQVVTADAASWQCDVKNRWPDGSAKIVLLSGAVQLGSQATATLTLGVAAAPAAAAPLSLADLQATGFAATLDFSGVGSVSWAAADLAAPFMSWVQGPQMSSWIYRKPVGSDAHLVAWMELRCYKSGAVEALVWLENGYLRVANPGARSGTVTLTVAGSQRYSGAVTLANHQRMVVAQGTRWTHWLDGRQAVIPQHDVAYLMQTRLVPNYRARTASTSALFARLPGRYTPLDQGSYPTAMGSGGYDPSIGLLPEWDVAYCSTSADARAYLAVMINACCAGRYGTHFRDETTHRPMRLSSYPTLTVGDGAGISSAGSSSTNSVTPTASGAVPPTYASSHHPSMGYMAYLLSGWHYFAEECQFVATLNYLKQQDVSRQGSKGLLLSEVGANTTRGAAWAWRTLGQAVCVSPDDDPVRVDLAASLDANVAYYHQRYVATSNNPLGLVAPYSNYNAPASPYTSAIWMDDFFTAAAAYVRDLGVAADTTRYDAFLVWKFRSVIGRLGAGGADEFAYPYAAQYTVNYAPSALANFANGSGPWYADWGQVARAMAIPTAAAAGAALDSGYPTDATSYWGNLMAALCMAVDHGAAGSAAAWQRVSTASNFSVVAATLNDAPVWGLVPR